MKDKGQTLLEVIVVMAVGVIVIGALVFATIVSLRNANFSKNQAQATKLAQEGIEKVRAGRDRNASISIPPSGVTSWNGNSAGPIWSYQIYNGCGSAGECYLKFSGLGSDITWIATSNNFPENSAETVSDVFKRAIILSDSVSTYNSEKKVTVVVTWTDFAGSHESRLTTILRKI